ncbi:hypothetical protein ACFP3T_05950 [Lactiplantibacillus dongliensis]|uniref:Uncharacterized protein n=1 Tax=Lactiplantibacillus dongliensis TaxID=2559919 RepID=A0ABW1R6E7_9LACO|nr:hypothetical protein [Lactiplantibacillus dongliensis]
MLKSPVLYGLLATVLLAPIVLESATEASANATDNSSNTVVTAAYKQRHTTSQEHNATGLTESQIQKINPYVTVLNNRYQLNHTASGAFNKQELKQIKLSISQANKTVIEQHLTIEPVTKSTVSIPESKAAWNSHYTATNFWWGTRYYFTSNAAVAEMTNELSNIEYGFDVAGVIGTLFTDGGAAAVATTATAYFNSMSIYLNHYNNNHRHNQIYMDVNYSGGYSCHVLA